MSGEKRSVIMDVEDITVEEAIKKAVKILGSDKDNVEIKVLKEEKKGLFGLQGSTPAKIRVTVKEPQSGQQ